MVSCPRLPVCPRSAVPSTRGGDCRPDLTTLEILRTAIAPTATVAQDPTAYGLSSLGSVLGKGGYGVVRRCTWYGPEPRRQGAGLPRPPALARGAPGLHPDPSPPRSPPLRLPPRRTDVDSFWSWAPAPCSRSSTVARCVPEEPHFYHRVARAALQIAEGVLELHRRGYVHCDLKPGNVITFDQDNKVGDFGAAAPPRHGRRAGHRHTHGARELWAQPGLLHGRLLLRHRHLGAAHPRTCLGGALPFPHSRQAHQRAGSLAPALAHTLLRSRRSSSSAPRWTTPPGRTWEWCVTCLRAFLH